MNRDEVYNETIKYFKGDSLAANVWIDKYCLKRGDDYLESTPDDMHRRLAKEFARIEAKYPNSLNEDEIYEVFKDFKYIVPQGRIMAGLGANESYRSLSNCLVLPSPKDSYSSIMYVDTMLVNAAKRGCGYGIDLSNLRPVNSPTKNASHTSTGIIPFMERYSNSTREVGQSGRRGACLLGIDINHPQILDFITAKTDLSKVTGANISVKIDDDFMKNLYDKEGDSIGQKFLWDKIISQAHKTAEPGVFYWSRMQNYDPANVYKDHKIVLTNACGEQPMSAFDTCRLIVINLYNIVKNPFTKEARIDWGLFNTLVYTIQRLGDDLVDLEIEYIDRILNKIKSDPEPPNEKAIELELWTKVKDKAIKGRRIGTGITGLGDMLAALGLMYGSEESLTVIENLFNVKLRYELLAQITLANERGSFPDFNKETEESNGNDFSKMLKQEYTNLYADMLKYGRRSINWSTIAPTGTTSLMTQTSSGCEPVYQLSYKRRRKVDENHPNKSFKDQNGDWWEEYELFHSKLADIPKGVALEDTGYYMSTAEEIDPVQRVKVQGILQKYTTSAISSTINLKEDTTLEEVDALYKLGWKEGLKGLTIYRQGSRTGVLISNSIKDDKFVQHQAPKRPKTLDCDIYKATSKGQKFTVLVGLYDNKPYELFATTNAIGIKEDKGKITKVKKGVYKLHTESNEVPQLMEHMSPEEQAITRLISTSLRHGTDVKFLVHQLRKNEGDVTTLSKVIARILSKYAESQEEEKCAECGAKVTYKDGCKICENGHSKCE